MELYPHDPGDNAGLLVAVLLMVAIVIIITCSSCIRQLRAIDIDTGQPVKAFYISPSKHKVGDTIHINKSYYWKLIKVKTK